MDKVLRKFLLGAALLLLVFLSLFPGADIKELETRLSSATGEKRLGILVEICKASQDSNKALSYGHEALDLLERFPDPKLQVDLLNHLSSITQYLGEYDAARKYTKQSLEIAKKNGYKKGHAQALFHIGRTYYYQGIYNQATSYLSQARQLYKELDDQMGVARTQNTFGMIHWRLGNYPRAMEYLLDAQKVYENPDQLSRQAGIGLAYSYNNIGLIYLSMEHYDRAMDSFRKAGEIHKALGNKWGIATVLNNIAEVYRAKKEYTNALNHDKQSLKIKQELGYKQGTATTLHNIGKVYEEMQEYQYALDYFNKALEIREELNDQKGISSTLIQLGRINRKLDQYPAALQLVNRGMEIAFIINVKTEIRDAYQELSEISAARSDYTKALQYYKKYKEINDTLFNETSNKRILELQTQYEMEKSQKEIALLKKNREIQNLDLAREKNINLVIILASILFFIVVFVIYIRYRLKVRMTRALNNEAREHKQTAKKLKESEEKFRQLAESAKVGIYILQDSIIQYVNPNLLSLFGYTREEIVGQSPLKLVRKEDQSLMTEKMNQRITGAGDTLRYEFSGITKNGEILHLESYGGVTRYQGRTAVLETVIDISKRKKTAEKLLRSQKLEAMGILAGGIAHDFNNLLVALVGYLGTLKDNIPKNSPTYEAVENIDKAHNQASELAQQLIAFSKGGWILPRQVPLTSILKDTIETHPEMESLIGGICIPQDLRPIYGDERQLMQVMGNLLCNANEAIPRNKKEKVKVNIDAKNIHLHKKNHLSLAQGDYVMVSLKDNGKGMPQDQLENIFEPFFSTKKNHRQKGIGLGLAICLSIIKKHHGHISIKSKPGKGTIVELILPAYQWLSH